MNKLPRPTFFDDHAALVALSQNARLDSHPHLQPYVTSLTAAYQQYVDAKGDAKAIRGLDIPDEIKLHLFKHYKDPPKDIGYISEIRKKSEVRTCPMCGSLHSGTLDHVLPKIDFPAFTIFGLNLVPACKCNSLRSTSLIGPNPGERILHPYFDDILGKRIIAARFTSLGLVPEVSLRLLLDPSNPDFSTVKFHVTNVVERTGILEFARIRWAQMMRRPGNITTELRTDPPSRSHLKNVLQSELERCDDVYESRNNWWSVFLVGLLEDSVLSWLYGRFTQPGRQPDDPLGA